MLTPNSMLTLINAIAPHIKPPDQPSHESHPTRLELQADRDAQTIVTVVRDDPWVSLFIDVTSRANASDDEYFVFVVH